MKIKEKAAFLLLRVMAIFPVKWNRVVFMSYDGAQYSCNPKYISEEMARSQAHLEGIWVLIKPRTEAAYKSVKPMSLAYFYYLATAKIIVTNQRLPSFYHKRKQQRYIQTWHSSLRLKKIEKDAFDFLPQSYRQKALRDSSMCDLLLSGCRTSTDIMNQAFWYDGRISEAGTPRNDVLVNEWRRKITGKQVKNKLGLSEDEQLAVIAPTFRQHGQPSLPNAEHLKRVLHQSFGGKWQTLIRLHPHIRASETAGYRRTDEIEDMQELLAAASIVITDYSSLMFDFMLTAKPLLLYTPDLDTYSQAERGFYFTFQELPFPIIRDESQLVEVLSNWSQSAYEKKRQAFLEKHVFFETGNASETIAGEIASFCKREEMSTVERI